MATPPATHPASYTAYAFTEPGGDLQKITVAWRDPYEGEVVLKVLACGVCATYVLSPIEFAGAMV